MKDQLDKLIILGVLLVSLGMLACFRADHDAFVFMSGVVTTVLGGLLGLVRGQSPTHTTQANTISGSTVTQSVEDTK